MRIVAIVQARMGSTRLPGKVLAEVFPGKTALACQLQRILASKVLTGIAVKTKATREDEAIKHAVESCGVQCIVGPEPDTLSEFAGAIDVMALADEDIVVRLTGDCPSLDGRVIDRVIDEYQKSGCDFASNSLEPYRWPDGMDVEVCTAGILRTANREAKLPSHRQHVTFFIWQQPARFRIHRVDCTQDLSGYRLTLDYPEDLALLRKVFGEFWARDQLFSMEEVVEYLVRNPDIRSLNAMHARNAGWTSALAEDAKVKKDGHR